MNTRRFSHIVLQGLLVLVALCAAIGPSAPVQAQSDAGWILGQINALRARYGVGPLQMNAALVNSATAHSHYLATNDWSDPHVEANGSTPRSRATAAGFTGPIVGENVYGGGLATAAIAFTWWVNEPVHFRNMLGSSYNMVGVGIANGPYGQYFTTDFGGTGDGANLVPAAPAPANSASGQSVAQAPVATRRPLPTLTPSITYTPSITFTPLPTDTPAPSTTAIPPTPTEIVLEVSPQGAAAPVVAMMPSATATHVPTSAVIALAPTLTPTIVPATKPASGGGGNSLFGTLLLAAVGVQVLIIAGFAVRQVRGR